MSEQEITRPDEDQDVEAHKKSRFAANDEAPKDDEAEDDVELHIKGGNKVK